MRVQFFETKYGHQLATAEIFYYILQSSLLTYRANSEIVVNQMLASSFTHHISGVTKEGLLFLE